MKYVQFFTVIILGALMMTHANAADFTLTSPDIAEGQKMDMQFVFEGCGGENVSPALAWQGAPEGTKSFALTAYDPDAPTGSGWWHWVAYNIPASVTSLPQGASGKMPNGTVEGHTDYGTVGYGGPCPPEGHGDHRYIFTIHALDVETLELPEGASAAMVGFNLWAHGLAKASITGVFGR